MTDQFDFLHKPTLHGDFVDLRPVRASDALILNVELDDPEVAVLTGSVNSRTAPDPAYEADELERIYQAWSTARDRMVWVVLRRPSSPPIEQPSAIERSKEVAPRSAMIRVSL